jgi:hypothetical protein
MTSVKAFGILVDQGWGGARKACLSPRSPTSHVIPPQKAKSGLSGDPGNRRDRKIKTSPLMNTDDTDQELGDRGTS